MVRLIEILCGGQCCGAVILLAPVHAPPQGHEASIIIRPIPFLKKNIPFQFTKVLKSPLKSAIILVQKDWRISTACMVSCKPCTFL